MVYFSAIRLSPGGHSAEHIVRVWWEDENSSSNPCGEMDVPTAVGWLKQGNRAFVRGGGAVSEVSVVEPGGSRPPYLRTLADYTNRDNLLALPQR